MQEKFCFNFYLIQYMIVNIVMPAHDWHFIVDRIVFKGILLQKKLSFNHLPIQP